MMSPDQIWGTGFYNYSYDAVGRLLEVEYPWSQVTYTYDSVGNRLTETEGIYRKNYVYNEENQLTDLTLYVTKPYVYPIHRYQWEYDANGNQRNQTVINGTTGPLYSYDNENRLILAQLDPYSTYPANVSYAYLPNGDRFRRVNDTETIYYLYDREDVVAIYRGMTDTYPIRILHGQGMDDPLVINIAGTGYTWRYAYVKDALGNVRALVNLSDYSIEAAYLYDAWGNVVNHTGPLSEQNSYLFTGREYDWQTNVYYYRARSYDANLGRFLQKDLIKSRSGENKYVYCKNDPVNNVDPSGHQLEIAVGFAMYFCIVYGWVTAGSMIVPSTIPGEYWDKYRHCVASCWSVYCTGFSPAAALTVGVLKELKDLIGRSIGRNEDPSWEDLWADFIGTGCAGTFNMIAAP